MTYRIYVRVSTAHQAESGHGLNAQEDACLAYCNGRESKIYRDAGVSGGAHVVDRPGLMELLNDFEKGDVLLVTKRDRMGRDAIIVAVLDKTIEEKGGAVVSLAGEGTESDDPSSILVRRIVDAISEYVKLNGKMLTRRALRSKRDRGERVGGIPYGYRLASDGVHLEVEDNEMKVVELVKGWRGLGWSLRDICNELEGYDIMSRSGKPFVSEQIRRMVKNG